MSTEISKPNINYVFQNHYENYWNNIKDAKELGDYTKDSCLKKSLENIRGVYIISTYNTLSKDVIYIGQALKTDFRQRLVYNLLGGGAHTLKKKLRENVFENDLNKTKDYLSKLFVSLVEINSNIENDTERTRFEHFAIAVLRPAFNDKYTINIDT